MASRGSGFLKSQKEIRKGKHFKIQDVGNGIVLQRNQSEA